MERGCQRIDNLSPRKDTAEHVQSDAFIRSLSGVEKRALPLPCAPTAFAAIDSDPRISDESRRFHMSLAPLAANTPTQFPASPVIFIILGGEGGD